MPSHFFNRLGETVLEIFKNSKAAIFNPQVGQAQSVEVIFLDRHRDIDIHGHEYGAPKPVAWFRTGLIDPVYKDEIEIENKNYSIVEIKPNGHEITELTLQEISDAC